MKFNLKMLALVMASSITGGAALAADFYVVVPVKGKTVNVDSINVSLAATALPAADFGASFSYDFKQNLQVTGDPTFRGTGVSWALASGALPSGRSLDASTGVLSGIPSIGGPASFSLTAAYKTKSSSQTYTVTGRYGVKLNQDGARTWSNGLLAATCKDYLLPSGDCAYTGDTGDGLYRIHSAGAGTQTVYCDMTTDGGGWTLVMRGLGLDYTGWGTTTDLNIARSALPPAAAVGTFKFADSTINAIRGSTGIYRLRSDGNFTRTRFVGAYTYSHTGNVVSGNANSKSYAAADLSGTAFTGTATPVNNGNYHGFSDDHGNWYAYFTTNYLNSRWLLGTGTYNATQPPASVFCDAAGNANCNFTLWVR